MQRAKITKCRNKYLWYFDELRKDPAKRREYHFNPAPDGRGIMIHNKGYVFKGDYKIIKHGNNI